MGVSTMRKMRAWIISFLTFSSVFSAVSDDVHWDEKPLTKLFFLLKFIRQKCYPPSKKDIFISSFGLLKGRQF
jgi:hypothetical protein